MDSMDTQEIARHRWHEAIRQTIVRNIMKKFSSKKVKTSQPTEETLSDKDRGMNARLKTMCVKTTYDAKTGEDVMVHLMQFSPDGKRLLVSKYAKISC